MGRGFKGATSSTASFVKDGGGSTAGRATDDTSCGLCKQEVAVQEEEHIVGLCTCCGSVPYHIPCVQDHLERTLRCQIREGGYNTKAWEKVQQKIKQRPWTLFSQNGGAQKLKVQCPACQGTPQRCSKLCTSSVHVSRRIAARGCFQIFPLVALCRGLCGFRRCGEACEEAACASACTRHETAGPASTHLRRQEAVSTRACSPSHGKAQAYSTTADSTAAGCGKEGTGQWQGCSS